MKKYWGPHKKLKAVEHSTSTKGPSMPIRSIGVGLAGTKTVLSLMNLPPVKCAADNKLQKIIHLSVKEVATEVMQGTVEEIREGASDDEITDVSISCDGT